MLGLVLGDLDLLAAPTLWYENDPLVIKAALRMGLPVLASRRGTLEEMVGPRGPEWLVEAGDVSAWTAALRRVTATPLPVFEPVRSKNLDDNAREMLAVYHSLACLRSKPAASAVASGGGR
jgi:glycosyltransferase involved in cell wall biosynthesis